MFRKHDTHVHFVGIGGIGMSGIAEILVNLGYRVTGTDMRSSATTARLAELGATVHQGHDASHLGDADVVVVSSAVPQDNPEVVAARARAIPVIPRAEMLAELMRLKRGVLIGGSHGKTTTTSIVATALHEAGLDPTVVIGGKVNRFDSNARVGAGDVLVAEADESDGSFLLLSPTVAVITNIDHEHLEHYGSFARLLDAFVGFANRVPFYGVAVVCTDDPAVAGIVPRLTKRTVTYGLDPGPGGAQPPDYFARDVRIVRDGAAPSLEFEVWARGDPLGPFRLHMTGRHNVLNALAAIAVCDAHDVPVEVTRAALAAFDGVQRRFTFKGERAGVRVFDDYGHHPTEIRATLAGARASYPDARLVAVVQPHRYTRLRDNFAGFAECVADADVVVVTAVYAAGERPIAGCDGEQLAARMREVAPDRPTLYVHELDALAPALAAGARPGDLVVTLGAGSITQVGPQLLAALDPRPEPQPPAHA